MAPFVVKCEVEFCEFGRCDCCAGGMCCVWSVLSSLVNDGKWMVAVFSSVDVVDVVVTVGSVVLGRDGSSSLMVVVSCDGLVVLVVGVDCNKLAMDIVVVASLACCWLCGLSCSRSSAQVCACSGGDVSWNDVVSVLSTAVVSLNCSCSSAVGGVRLAVSSA